MSNPDKFRRVLAVMRAYWPRGSKKVQPASVLPVSLKGQMNQKFDIFYFSSILVKYV